MTVLTPLQKGGESSDAQRADGYQLPSFPSQAVEFRLVFQRIVRLPNYPILPQRTVHHQHLRDEMN